ncbi:MAG: hypothetical protein ACI4IK_00160 [Eubacterium sp.]
MTFEVKILFSCYDEDGDLVLVDRPLELSTDNKDFVLSASMGYLLTKIDQSETAYNYYNGK